MITIVLGLNIYIFLKKENMRNIVQLNVKIWTSKILKVWDLPC